jgi:hypothetical protein
MITSASELTSEHKMKIYEALYEMFSAVSMDDIEECLWKFFMDANCAPDNEMLFPEYREELFFCYRTLITTLKICDKCLHTIN